MAKLEEIANPLDAVAKIKEAEVDATKKLLEDVYSFYEKKVKIQKERIQRGELFNIFDILDRRKDETKGHSAFLYALLNPEGLHGCGEKFLEAFCKVVCSDFEFDCKNAYVKKEEYIGPKSKNGETGGKIDIVIFQADNKKIIAIENKITAGDQETQLLRYKNYCTKYKEGNFRLFYLTLEGEEPSEYSTGGELKKGKDYFTISYKDDISRWLGHCKEIAKDKRGVLSSIEQYDNLIEQITKQNKENEMDEKVIDLLVGKTCEDMGKNIPIAEMIKDNIDAAKVKLFKQKIGVQLEKSLKAYDTLEIMDTIGDKNSGFEIRNKDLPDYVSIWFVFENNNWSNLFSGIYFCDTGEKTKSIRDYICKIAKENDKWCGEENYSCDEYPLNNYMPQKYRNIDTATLLDIAKDPTDFCTEVKKRTEHYSKIIEDALSQK